MNPLPRPMKRLAGMLIVLTPGLLLLGLAITANFGPLEAFGSGINPAQIVLLLPAVAALAFGMFVHAKAVKDQKAVGRPYAKTVLFVAVPTLVLILLTVVVAEIAARLLPVGKSPGLIFPPNSRAGFHTLEFEYTVETNSIGIRDQEIDPRQKRPCRIIALGDSFTNGWGVSLDESWPKVLQARLRAAGWNVEVLNLGATGASPKDYALLARRGIPLLQPDLVLVGVLQGDDIAQLHFQEGNPDRSTMQKLVEWTLPNLSRRLAQLSVARPLHISPDQMRTTWQHQARTVYEQGLTAEQAQRWALLDGQVKQMYRDGDLNPAQLQVMLKHPGYFSFTLAPDKPEVRDAIDTLGGHFQTIRCAAAKVGAEVIVIPVPAGPYVSRASLANFRRLGFQFDDASLDNDAPDDVIRSACERAGVEFHSLTDRFRQASSRRTLYFEFDGHFNPDGQALFGQAMAKVLRQRDARASTARAPSDSE